MISQHGAQIVEEAELVVKGLDSDGLAHEAEQDAEKVDYLVNSIINEALFFARARGIPGIPEILNFDDLMKIIYTMGPKDLKGTLCELLKAIRGHKNLEETFDWIYNETQLGYHEIKIPQLIELLRRNRVESPNFLVITRQVKADAIDSVTLPPEVASISLKERTEIVSKLIKIFTDIRNYTGGLIHGEIKPANVLLEKTTNNPVAIDFGSTLRPDWEIIDRRTGKFEIDPQVGRNDVFIPRFGNIQFRFVGKKIIARVVSQDEIGEEVITEYMPASSTGTTHLFKFTNDSSLYDLEVKSSFDEVVEVVDIETAVSYSKSYKPLAFDLNGHAEYIETSPWSVPSINFLLPQGPMHNFYALIKMWMYFMGVDVNHIVENTFKAYMNRGITEHNFIQILVEMLPEEITGKLSVEQSEALIRVLRIFIGIRDGLRFTHPDEDFVNSLVGYSFESLTADLDLLAVNAVAAPAAA